MAKKSVPAKATWHLPARELSFDGGNRNVGGLGAWYPAQPPSSEIDSEIRGEDGKFLDDRTAQYCVGCLVGRKAAEEYVEYLRRQDSNFWDDELSGELSGIAMDMLMGVPREDNRRRGEAIGFFDTLYGYLAFGARTIRASDKADPETRKGRKSKAKAA